MARTATPVVQEAHGFVRGTVVVFDGDDWGLATTGGPGVGVVGDILSADAFEFVHSGAIDGLEDLTPGTEYYTDALGQLSTTANGPSVGVAYTDRVLFVSPGATAAASTGVSDTSLFATQSQIAALQAAIAAVATAIPSSDSYIHSIQDDAVISVTPGASGIVFLESDGTQVLTE